MVEKLAEKNAGTDVLVCGDFNDTPDAPQVVDGLHAVGDRKRVVKTNRNPQLLDLFANKDPKQFGTIWYANKPQIYDQICVSAGMLDTVRVELRSRFGFDVDGRINATGSDAARAVAVRRSEPQRSPRLGPRI